LDPWRGCGLRDAARDAARDAGAAAAANAAAATAAAAANAAAPAASASAVAAANALPPISPPLSPLRGRAVQVDPIKPTTKAPASKSLNLKYDKLLSNVAFKYSLRHYSVGLRWRLRRLRPRHRGFSTGLAASPHLTCRPRRGGTRRRPQLR